MRIPHYLIVATACLVLAGCRNGSSGSGGESAGTHQGRISEDRQAFLDSVQQQMRAMDDKIADLAERSRGLRDDARTQANQALEALRKQRAELGRKFDDLKDSSRDAWQDAKAGFSNAWQQMQDSFASARSRFN